MIQTILGTKSNMTAIYNRFGHQIPVTHVVVEPNIIVGLKEGRVILGYGKKKKPKKTENAFIKIAGYSPRFTREIKIKQSELKKAQTPQENSPQNQQTPETNSKINLGKTVTVSIFEAGDEVKVTGTTKGKGFAGGVKRWGFAGGPKTHGQSDRHRAIGSIGAGTTPGRVFKGKKMPGHMGNEKLTVTGLEIIEVNEGKNLLVIKGAIPGPKDGFLIIEKVGKVKGYTPPPPPSEEKQAEKEAREEKKEEEQKEVKEEQKTGSKQESQQETKQEVKNEEPK